MPYFSVIMQSTLKDYAGAASNRPEKLVRAIESVLNQTFKDLELIVVSDNCKETDLIVCDIYDTRLTLISSKEKTEKWASVCRNKGKDYTKSKYCLYIDNDDYYSPEYLQDLYNAIQLQPATWYIADHYEWVNQKWKYIRANVSMNSAGTANVIHSTKMFSRWPDSGHYGSEDWTFIKRLLNESKDYKHLDLAGYHICHIRDKYCI